MGDRLNDVAATRERAGAEPFITDRQGPDPRVVFGALRVMACQMEGSGT